MPEIPDLLYIQNYLSRHVQGRSIVKVAVKQPVLLRVAIAEPYSDALLGKVIGGIHVHGPFLHFTLSGDMVINLMLAGRLQHQHPGEKSAGYPCVSFSLDDGSTLNVCDERKMGKIYIVPSGKYSSIPRFESQGIDILSPAFTIERFRELLKKHSRKQVRVLINDHTVLSAIGNAYADETLFEARIHPKTFVARLTPDEQDRLFDAIGAVLRWGIDEVTKASLPIQEKVREHMRVRNRRGEPCLRCGTKIRREGVRGHDVFFCPTCQPPSRTLFLDWRKL
jgi:formamidopyrimidine-DNA glycosylase